MISGISCFLLFQCCSYFLLLQLTSQIITFEHEGNWSKALEYYDLLVRSASIGPGKHSVDDTLSSSHATEGRSCWKSYKGLMRSLQKTGCTHVLDVYCQGLTISNGCLQHDTEFADMQVDKTTESVSNLSSFMYCFIKCQLMALYFMMFYFFFSNDTSFELCSMKLLGGLEIGTSHLSAEMQVLHILHNLQVVVNSMRTCIGANLFKSSYA